MLLTTTTGLVPFSSDLGRDFDLYFLRSLNFVIRRIQFIWWRGWGRILEAKFYFDVSQALVETYRYFSCTGIHAFGC